MGYFDNDSLNKYKKILILIRIFLRYILNIKNINLIFIRCILILKQNKQKKNPTSSVAVSTRDLSKPKFF
jgi:hypothetical protein